jgi:glycosyltransferase involved in cell wall biosynthesis
MSLKPFLVSAIVSTYNAEQFIAGCLDDLEAQTIADRLEIIVVDSCSDQNEREIVAAYQRRFTNIRYIRTEKRERLYAAWNRGIREASGRYITNANTDDRHFRYALEFQTKALDEHPDAGIVYADILVTDRIDDILQWPALILNNDTGAGNRKGRLCTYPEFSLLSGLTGSNFGPQPMWRRSVHDAIGYFDESYTVAGDYDFFYHTAWRFGAVHIPQPLGLYFENLTGIEKTNKDATISEFSRLRDRYYAMIPLTALIPQLAANPDDRTDQGYAWWKLGDNCLAARPRPEFRLAAVFYGNALAALGEKPKLIHNVAASLIGSGNSSKGLKFLEKAALVLPESRLLLEKWKPSKTDGPEIGMYFPAEADREAFEDQAKKEEGPDRSAENAKEKAATGPGGDATGSAGGILANAKALRQQGRFDRAVQTLMAGIRTLPAEISLYHGLAEMLMEASLFSDALHILRNMPTAAGDVRRWELAGTCCKSIAARAPATTQGTVSLCMIVRNEAERLGQCLLSIYPFVREIVIVDTGSTDRTRDIAAAFGALIYDVPWTDDFSAARNFSISKATGDWILALDADEVVAEKDLDAFRELITSSTSDTAYGFVTRNYVTDFNTIGWSPNTGAYAREEAGCGWFPSTKVRLFPRREEVRFEYPIHEIVENSLKRAGITVRSSGIPIHHYGKLNRDQDLVKGETYYLLGRKKLAEMMDNPKFIAELAIQGSGLGRDDEALDLWRQVARLEPGNADAYMNISALLIRLGRYREALEAANRARDLSPCSGGVLYNCAICEIFCDDLNEAISDLDRLLRYVPEYVPALALLAAAYMFKQRQPEGAKILSALHEKGIDWVPYFEELSKRMIADGRREYASALTECMNQFGVRQDANHAY